MIEDQLISFKTARWAKEKGFNKSSLSAYNLDGILGNFYEIVGENPFDWPDEDEPNYDDLRYSAPTQCTLQKWLREVFNIHIHVSNYYQNTKGYKPEYCLYVNGKQHGWSGNSDGGVYLFRTYEDALEVALQESLKLI